MTTTLQRPLSSLHCSEGACQTIAVQCELFDRTPFKQLVDMAKSETDNFNPRQLAGPSLNRTWSQCLRHLDDATPAWDTFKLIPNVVTKFCLQ